MEFQQNRAPNNEILELHHLSAYVQASNVPIINTSKDIICFEKINVVNACTQTSVMFEQLLSFLILVDFTLDMTWLE